MNAALQPDSAPAGPRVLHVFRDPPLDGPTNMARDEYLLHSDSYRPAAIRIYAWTPPTISLGYFQRYSALDDLPAEVRDLAVVRRTTGGGAILHDREITYCLTLDASVPLATQSPTALYRAAHTCWRDALAADGPQAELAPEHFPLPTPRTGPFFCFQKPGQTDLIVGDRKLLGSAQRRLPGRVLQHGSLLLAQRFAAHPGVNLNEPPAKLVAQWIDRFLTNLAAVLQLECRPAEWTPEDLADCAERRERYADAAWTERR